MSFMSGSAKARAVKEFVLCGAQSPDSEGVNLRSDRFHHRVKGRKGHHPQEAMIVSNSRRSALPSSQESLLYFRDASLSPTAQDDDLLAAPYGFESDKEILDWCLCLAQESPTAKAMINHISKTAWSLRLDDLSQQGYVVDDNAQTIVLDHYGFGANALGRSIHYRCLVLTSFLRALRDVAQRALKEEWADTHRPESLLMLERAFAADRETMVILIGWELRAAGYVELWRFILGAEEGDMAMIFTRAMENDPAGFYDGSVLTRTFCQWYGDADRVAGTDHTTLESMDERLQKRDAHSKFGSNPATAQDFEKIARLGAQSYLKGMGQNIKTDPYFVAINDPINESHLFQVVYDSNVVMVEGVPFSDRTLARLIFPSGHIKAV